MEDNGQRKLEKNKPTNASLGATVGKDSGTADTADNTAASQQATDAGQQNSNAGPDNIGTSTPVSPDMNH